MTLLLALFRRLCIWSQSANHVHWRLNLKIRAIGHHTHDEVQRAFVCVK